MGIKNKKMEIHADPHLPQERYQPPDEAAQLHFPAAHSKFFDTNTGAQFSMPPDGGGFDGASVDVESHPVAAQRKARSTAVHSESEGVEAEAHTTPTAESVPAGTAHEETMDEAEPRGQQVRRVLGGLATRAVRRFTRRGRVRQAQEQPQPEVETPDYEALQRDLDQATGDLAKVRADREVRSTVYGGEAIPNREDDDELGTAQAQYDVALGSVFAAHRATLPRSVTESPDQFEHWKAGFAEQAERALRRTVDDAASEIVHEDLTPLGERLQGRRDEIAAAMARGVESEDEHAAYQAVSNAYETTRGQYGRLLRMGNAYRGEAGARIDALDRAWQEREDELLGRAVEYASAQAAIRRRIKHGARPQGSAA
jgi:hypothetical protein